MDGRDPLMIESEGDGLGRLEETAGAVGELLEVHGVISTPWVNPDGM